MELRPLGETGIAVSPVGLGTVKLGRDQQVKYPRPFRIPDDGEAAALLGLARDLGINLIDTAPAYGSSEERLGRLLPGPREGWVIASKTGECFEDGRSRFDFSAAGTRASVERSLRRLRTDYLDLVLVHSDGDDERILRREEVLDALIRLREQGLVRAVGLSGKTVAGGLLAVELTDVVMVTFNPRATDETAVIRAARAAGRGVLVKKALDSGHLADGGGGDPVADALAFVFSEPGVSSVILGTVSPTHLRENVLAAERAVAP